MFCRTVTKKKVYPFVFFCTRDSSEKKKKISDLIKSKMSTIRLSSWQSLPLDRTDNAPWPSVLGNERKELLRKCGKKCFIVETPELKFPVCRPDGDCKISAAGVRAARRRAILTRGRVGDRYDDVVSATDAYIKKHRLTLGLRHGEITRVSLRVKPVVGVSLRYSDGTVEPFRPLAKRTILRLYGSLLTSEQKKRLANL